MEKIPFFKQVWTIAKIELKRAFFSKRAFWVYGLALFPTVIFLGHAVNLKIQHASLSRTPLTRPALMDSVRDGETADAILERLGKPASDNQWERRQRLRDETDSSGVTIHAIEPPVETRYVRLNIFQPTQSADPAARIFEFEVYGETEVNLALDRPATGSHQCNEDTGPEKAFNGNVEDNWCSQSMDKSLQVDLGHPMPVSRIILKHAEAAGMEKNLNTGAFTVEASQDNKRFETIVNITSALFVNEITRYRRMRYFDGKREAVLNFTDGKLSAKDINPLMDFEADRAIFASVFQLFYLRLAIFFGCLGIFMNLFRGEILDKTLHFWFLAPARREVLLIGKYGAGLIASSIIFAGGALLCFAVLMGSHSSVEVSAYLENSGMQHIVWYLIAAVMGCIGYGSVFLAAGLLLRNPIIPAAVLLGWEGIQGFLPETLQKLSILHYLQSLCPVPIPMNDNVPGLLRLLLTPAAPASHIGAIIGLLILSAVVLWISVLAIRRTEVSYSAE